MIKLDICIGSCDILNDLSNKVCVPNKAEDLNLSVFNMITGINKSKTLTKHVSYKIKCKFEVESVIQIKSGIMKNVGVNVKNVMYAKKIILGILLHAVAAMVNI